MPSKRSILEELTLDELRANLDDYELGVDDRRVRTQLVDALARARQVRVADILVDLSRKRLQELCRSLGLVQSGRRKAELVQRLSGSASPPKERPPADKKPSADSLALERVLLKNLLERLDADAAAEQPQLRSVVSDAERSALRELLGAGGSSLTRPPTAPGSPPPDPAPPPRPPSSRPPTAPAGTGVTELTSPPVELNTAALGPGAEPLPGWVLCLDFGTAKSKAFAAADDEEEPELEPLAVGQADDDLDGAVHEVSSCVWIDDGGRLFVGSEAVKRGMNYGHELGPHRPLRCDHHLLGLPHGLGDDGARIPFGDAVRAPEIHRSVVAAVAAPLGRRAAWQEPAARAVAGGYVPRPVAGGYSRSTRRACGAGRRRVRR